MQYEYSTVRTATGVAGWRRTEAAQATHRGSEGNETALDIGFDVVFIAATVAQYAICLFGGFWATGGNPLGGVALVIALYTGRCKAHVFTVLAGSILLFLGPNSLLSVYLRQVRTGETVDNSPEQRRRFVKAATNVVVGGFVITLLATLLHMAVLLLLTVPVAIGFAVYALFVPDMSAWGVVWRLFAVAGVASLLCWPALHVDHRGG